MKLNKVLLTASLFSMSQLMLSNMPLREHTQDKNIQDMTLEEAQKSINDSNARILKAKDETIDILEKMVVRWKKIVAEQEKTMAEREEEYAQREKKYRKAMQNEMDLLVATSIRAIMDIVIEVIRAR